MKDKNSGIRGWNIVLAVDRITNGRLPDEEFNVREPLDRLGERKDDFLPLKVLLSKKTSNPKRWRR